MPRVSNPYPRPRRLGREPVSTVVWEGVDVPSVDAHTWVPLFNRAAERHEADNKRAVFETFPGPLCTINNHWALRAVDSDAAATTTRENMHLFSRLRVALYLIRPELMSALLAHIAPYRALADFRPYSDPAVFFAERAKLLAGKRPVHDWRTRRARPTL